MKRAVFFAALLLPTASVGAAGLVLELGRLVHPAVVVDGLSVRLGGAGQSGEIRIGRLTAADHVVENLSLTCPQLAIDAGVVNCRNGQLAIPGVIDGVRVDLSFNPESRAGSVALQSDEWGLVEARLHSGGHVEVSIQALPVSTFGKRFPQLGKLGPDGILAGKLDYCRQGGEHVIKLRGQLTKGRFSSADGLQAAENLQLSFELDARSQGSAWDWQTRLDWLAGEAYVHPLYVTSGPVVLAHGRLQPGRAFIEQASLTLDGVGALSIKAEIDLDRTEIVKAAIKLERGDLAQLGPRFVAPLIAPAQAESLRFAGLFSLNAVVAAGEVERFDLSLDQAGFSLADSGLSFGPVSGVLPWHARDETRVLLQIEGGRWQKLELGAFAFDARLNGLRVRIDEMVIPILDGRMILSDLDLDRQSAGWSGRGGVAIEPISMKIFTEAVGLPPMSGVLSASMPSLRVRPGEIVLDGALVISVFDGYLQVTGLQVLEPFGRVPHLSGDLEARNLDLFQLTETFSFGSISGFIDADVRGLELVGWAPVHFDAVVRSSVGDYRRRISQRAVENISALGGPGASLAIQRGFLSFFDSFGYRQIGLSCQLRGDVCLMGGIEDQATGERAFTIVQGGGVPALNVIGYNRRVDWVELLERIKRVVESNTTPVIE